LDTSFRVIVRLLFKTQSIFGSDQESYKFDKSLNLRYIADMINNYVSIDEFRSNLAELMGKVMYGQNRVMIKKYNREAAVLISVDEYEKLLDPTKRLTKSQWDEAVKKLDAIRANIPEADPKEIQKKINQAIQEVRVKNKRIHA